MREADVLEGLKASGLDIGNARDLLDVSEILSKKNLKLPSQVTSWLLGNLGHIDGTYLLGPVHQALLLLRRTSSPFPGKTLVNLFEEDKCAALRPAIAGTIIETSPTGVVDWLERTIAQAKYDDGERFLLYSAYAKLAPPDVACGFLAPHFGQAPVAVGMAYAYCGGERELAQLNELLKSLKDWDRQEIKKAIARVETRIRRKAKSVPNALAPELGPDAESRSGLEPQIAKKKRR